MCVLSLSGDDDVVLRRESCQSYQQHMEDQRYNGLKTEMGCSGAQKPSAVFSS